ncbi:MAG: AMP-binding protein, partial [Bacteroidales bacterium]|nr:AMP-binding protein [Bacteroidales bacterium]
ALVDHSESKVLFTDTDLWKKLDIEKMPMVRTVVSVTDFTVLYAADDEVRTALASLPELFAARYPDGFSIKDVDYPVGNDKELAIINYTSGTTSAPKGVMLRYECLTSNVEFGQDHIPSSPEDSIVSMLPMAHMYGMMFEFLYPLCGGSTVYYLGKTPTPALLLGAMKDVQPYLLITVPLVMEKIFRSSVQPVLKKPVMKAMVSIPGVNRIIFNKIRGKLMAAFGGRVRMIIMGGAALNPEVEKWFTRIGLPFTVGYGMTEAAPLLAYSPCDRFVPRSCGKAVDREEVRIDSEDPQNVVGEIQARGTNIMSGYYKNEEATRAAFTEDGWMNTGDLGVIDADGNIFIRGRSKNMILSSNGQNIYPEEVEAVINSQPYVVETVVVDRASKLVALVYLDRDKLKNDGLEGEQLDLRMSEMMKAVNRDLPSYSKITRIETVDSPFEKTPKMSIKRFMYR